MIITFSSDYPYEAPTVKFVNQIYHPNIDLKTGTITLLSPSFHHLQHHHQGILCSDGKWSVVYDTRVLLLSIRSLIAYPCIPNTTTADATTTANTSTSSSFNAVTATATAHLNAIDVPNKEAASMYTTDTATYNEICLLILADKAPVDDASLQHYDDDQDKIMMSIIDSNESLKILEDSPYYNEKKPMSNSSSSAYYNEKKPMSNSSNSAVGNDNIIHRLCRQNNVAELKNVLNNADGTTTAMINATNANKNTGLHIACNFGYKELASLLLAHGANTSIRNKNGRTPYESALFNERLDTVQLFTNTGNASLCNVARVAIKYCTVPTTTATVSGFATATASTTTTTPTTYFATSHLLTKLIHNVFEYIHRDFKLLIHREGSTDEERVKRLSIEVIMSSGLEDYFQEVLLCPRFQGILCNNAVRIGYISTLKWARDHRCHWNSTVTRTAASKGYLECLKWARENGCHWNEYTCRAAALGGHLHCLIWAREHGCPWDSNTCEAAASEGHLDILIWAREHGCPWDSYTCRATARKGHLDCLIWAREHGCDWNLSQCRELASSNNHQHILDWLSK